MCLKIPAVALDTKGELGCVRTTKVLSMPRNYGFLVHPLPRYVDLQGLLTYEDFVFGMSPHPL